MSTCSSQAQTNISVAKQNKTKTKNIEEMITLMDLLLCKWMGKIRGARRLWPANSYKPEFYQTTVFVCS